MEADEPFSKRRILIVAAHPDDEVIGAGAQLRRAGRRIGIVHVTDGAPENPGDATRAGVQTREEYAALRRREVLNAVALAGIAPSQCRELGCIDQQASLRLAELARAIAGLMRDLLPHVVLTHPYEGGHPDHDACAFAVAAAAEMVPTPVWEFTSYHVGPSGMETGIFLPARSAAAPLTFQLTPDEKQLKREMFDRFASQKHVLAPFSLDTEAFRRAPKYDFTQPPHPGRLHYEQFAWGMTGARWRQAASDALTDLGLQLHATHNS